ncbi:hypothetical protein HCA58_21510 [Micromonospora sp. HNM0581]|uniref:hypothetical protein n=1 Tax=Micromonospora sp. HNM0581 TaxID=2716341 RepID=UPI00146A534F|nr:hypothetical protein [Micromonospora sp. HNM0581]NLU80888.1 hypothetical protein [Micromonospora sp. HNM0581]
MTSQNDSPGSSGRDKLAAERPSESDLELEHEQDEGEESDTSQPPNPIAAAVDSLVDWSLDERSKNSRIALAVFAFGTLVLCCLNEVLKEHGDKIATWFKATKERIDETLTPTQQVAALAGVAPIIAYQIWRRIQIRRGIKPVPWMLIALTVITALGFTVLATWLMFREASNAPAESAAQLRFDAVKTGITLFAGTAGAGALLLSFRSHFNSETDRLNSQFDSAADKMSDDSQVVQTAGILAIERIALKYPSYRRSAIALLSSYLEISDGRGSYEARRVTRRLKGLLHRLGDDVIHE